MVQRESTQLSERRQCELLKVNRNRLESPPPKAREEDLELCQLIDRIYTEDPTYGSRRIQTVLQQDMDWKVGRHRVRRLMRLMGIEAIFRKPRTSLPGRGPDHQVFPYLLKDKEINAPDQVWCADITYVPMGRSHAYLFAIMDWYSRSIIAWEISNTLDTRFCLETLQAAVEQSGVTPEIFNTDQGCQFTSTAWREALEGQGIQISMDGKGCWRDNVFIERFWRTIKYEEIYLREYQDLHELEANLERWISRYNHKRRHQGLDNQRPWDLYRPKTTAEEAA